MFKKMEKKNDFVQMSHLNAPKSFQNDAHNHDEKIIFFSNLQSNIPREVLYIEAGFQTLISSPWIVAKVKTILKM